MATFKYKITSRLAALYQHTPVSVLSPPDQEGKGKSCSVGKAVAKLSKV